MNIKKMTIVHSIWLVISITFTILVSTLYEIEHSSEYLTFMILSILSVTMPYLTCMYVGTSKNDFARDNMCPKVFGGIVTFAIYVTIVYYTARIASFTQDNEDLSDAILLSCWFCTTLFNSIMMSVNIERKKRRVTATIVY